ncbi:alanine acetyltransferase [Aeromonas caviae]|uniref:GNAT family N-acetyltransferase n=1 Tax=Aeromonas caviae TaxID=648 RepID=UPI00084DFEED|nr:GNAT family N-acetyltransferase [Aeromonas caviae]OEG03168.1 alanine acetyltransferase [Aeromonas caviae]
MTSMQQPHIRLDPVSDTDLPHIYRGLSDPRVVAYYGVSYDSLAACRAQMDWYAELTRTGRGAWHLIRDRHTGEPLGAIGYNDADPTHRCAELGYWLYPEHWGKGVMSAALQLWLPLTYRTTDLHRLMAVVEEPNHPSARLLERAGFYYEGTARECERKGDGFISLRHYAILRSDLPASL